MRPIVAIMLASFAITMVSSRAQTRPPRPISIFNGKNLSGWQGDPALWSVVDGVITGTSSTELEQNSFLIYTAGDVEDFELTLKARVTGDNNSGIQYRSRLADEAKFIVSGYQLDIHPRQDLVGMVYEERGRGILARRGNSVRALTEKNDIVGGIDATERIDISEWNEYSIIARGNHLTHKINGKVASTLRDENVDSRSLKGIIALQLHAGAAMRVEAKDIVLRRLIRAHVSPPEELNPKPPTSLPQPKWITPNIQPTEGDATYFRHNWRVKAPASKATLNIAASTSFDIFLNGKEVGKGSGARTVQRFDLTDGLTEFSNTLAIRLTPDVTAPAIVAQIDFEHVDGSESRQASDQYWISHTGTKNPERWLEQRPDLRNWKESKVTARAADFFPKIAPPEKPERSQNQLTTPPGFRLEKVYDVPIDTRGSWVALTAGPDGSLFASAQNGGLYQITVPTDETKASVKKINLDIDHANGLLWAFGSLFVSVNHPAKSGLYRIDDRDQDGTLDSITTLRRFVGSGEHGPHGIAQGPSPQSIYLVCGNQTELPEVFGRRRPPPLWRADQLLTPNNQKPSPGAWIAMTRADGVEWELHSVGLRNPYDLAVNRHGDLFTADGSAPSDEGTPFFRPASLYLVPNGADFGARGGAQNFPSEYPDTVPEIGRLAPGSPTGITFGYGAAFPARFQEALYVSDWSNSTITAMHLRATSSSYTTESEPFIVGPDLPITDITIGSDHAMYFITGGREKSAALWRVTYTGDEPTTPTTLQPFSPEIERKQALLDKLGHLQGIPDQRVIATAWPHLADPDRLIRHAARTAIEHHSIKLWLPSFTDETNTDAILESAVALARAGLAEHQSILIEKLVPIDFNQLTSTQKINYLRAIGLTFIRLAPPTTDQRNQLVEKFSPTFPSRDEPLNHELAKMLIYLSTPTAIEPTLKLLNDAKTPDSAAAYATFLSAAKDGWTPAAKGNYLAWFKTAATQPGNQPRKTYLQRLESAFLGRIPQKTNE